jgi:hypothetical protein
LTATQLLKAVSFGLYINQNDLKTKKKSKIKNFQPKDANPANAQL